MSEVAAEGRPTEGQQLTSSMQVEAQKRARQRDLRPLARLWPFVRDHAGDALIAGFFLLLSTGASLGLAASARIVIDKGLASGSVEALNRNFAILGAVALALALATASRYFFVTKLGERVVADLRTALYRHVLTLDQAQFLKTRTGEVLSRLTTDITIVESLLATSASVALRNSLMVVGALIMLLITDWRLTVYVFLLAPLVIAPLFIFGRNVRRLSVLTQERFAEAVGYAGENLDALDTVQAFGREDSAGRRFGAAVESAFQTSLSRIRARAFMTAIFITLTFGGVSMVLWLGSRAVLRHEITGGQLGQFVLLSVMGASAVGALGEVWGEVQKAAGAMSRINELLSARPEIAPPERPLSFPTPVRGEIAFEDVTFAYPGRPDLPALRDFSLKVRPGETVALVGPSGAGKSTVLRLLLRFYDPQSGGVRIDGVDIRNADPKLVRAQMALVAQDASLFSGSARENIRFGRQEATDEEIVAAARAAEAEGFLMALPQGLDTPVGERAKTLSGGQRQRLAIARALVRGAPILLLDEATSALDAENERLVQKALAEAMTGRTTLVIAHRLATVLKADRIIVVDEGRVVEEGTHAELSARGGLYAKLAKLQFTEAAA
jgi:ATP-binding cassette subfamily B protein